MKYEVWFENWNECILEAVFSNKEEAEEYIRMFDAEYSLDPDEEMYIIEE